MLRTRLITALLLAPLILAIVFLGEPWLSLLIGIVAFLALVEVVALLDAAGYEPPQVLAIVAGIALTAAGLVSANEGGVGGVVTTLLTALDPPGLVAATLVAAMLLLALVSFTRADPRAGFQTWATTTFGISYVGLLLPAIVLVAHLAPAGGSWNTPVGAVRPRLRRRVGADARPRRVGLRHRRLCDRPDDRSPEDARPHQPVEDDRGPRRRARAGDDRRRRRRRAHRPRAVASR